MDAAAEIYQKCGVRIVTAPQTNAKEKKSPTIAAIASVILPGLGQFYTEQTRKGIILVVVAVLLLYVIVAYRTIVSELADFLYAVLLIYSAYDSYNTAKAINLGTA
jgi:TM2 domain-containing membrane protein YozV